MTIIEAAKKAREAAICLAAVGSDEKNKALMAIAKALEENKEAIEKANAIDRVNSEKEQVALPLLKRLKFDDAKRKDVIAGIESLCNLEDPVGKVQLRTELDTELILTRVACPIGVVGIIFESRPDALVQISTLCLKSGNGVLLKGGSEAKETNRILFEIIKEASLKAGMPEGWIALMESREDVSAILKLDKYIDLLVPRGSNDFVSYIMKNTNIPVIGHADGICHTYVDKEADLDMAVKVVVDSKTQYVVVCNALETLLVHKEIAPFFLPQLKQAMDEKKVKLKGCARTREIIEVEEATEEDWQTEYLDYMLSIKVVESIKEAIDHINTYGSGHTDCIITTNEDTAQTFMMLVDSGNVFHNVSTRFSDGFRYGFGAEVGVSTSKIHARGPVGLEGLLIYKYKLVGKGHIVEDYASGDKHFTHKKL
ncbi:glutamate-5-semialdehyde dehydrogenase [Sporanaerobium hydrogeniformans]|uniref:Glutamate-5-semialdehyde dehydrogenase n=2 Tax=Sporanaerobium hydrogeniformans TaxID=3072179 RepID=A0AC61DH34_9FIRM|nr:glutamate-5-semialdehyde dehydrogenase [Sporanaerobium hydrogeniformans]PHV71946.1 glutamate-5-semialdehyde dehydrogenase [Sporanaerobium hydrogeniformans]